MIVTVMTSQSQKSSKDSQKVKNSKYAYACLAKASLVGRILFTEKLSIKTVILDLMTSYLLREMVLQPDS